MPLNAGDIAFVGFNADGNDNIAFVALTDISAGEVIVFEDNEWNGTGWADTNESAFSWTATSAVTAGTIVSIDNIGAGTTTASTGTITFPVAGRGTTRGLANSGESLYAYQGNAAAPTFITAVSNNAFADLATGLLTNTGLTAGVNAIALANNIDIGAYNGSRSGQTSFAAYRSLINDPANWQTQDGTGDQISDAIAPDLPFSTTAFTVSTNSSAAISSLTLIGSGTLADTAVAGVFGDLSGITYDAANNTYRVVSDATNRFFTVQIAIDAAANTVTPTHLNGTETSILLNISGGFTAPDLEGIALDSSGNVFVSSEGAYTTLNPLAPDNSVLTENPFIKRFNPNGTDVLTLNLPSRFTTSSSTQGPRNNGALESLTLTPNNTYLFTAVEGPLKQDQSLAFLPAPFGSSAPPLNRLVRFDFSGGVAANAPSQEFLYIGDAGYGLSELLAINNSGDRLLSLERAANTSGVVTGVKVFEISLAGATDISGNAGLGGNTSGITSVTKTLLADFSTPALSNLLANYEGVTFGPLLPDGRRSLVLVSDNGGSGNSRFTAFAVNEAATLVTLIASDDAAAEAGQNPGTFRISRTGSTTNALTVNYAIATGTGQAVSADYTPTLTGSITIPIGQSFVDITLTPVDDTLFEGNETVTLTLLDGATYDLGATTSATVTIADNETAPTPYALASIFVNRTDYSNNSTPTDITDDTITYSLSLQVRSTDNTGQNITPAALAGIDIPGLPGKNILVADAIPAGTELFAVPTAPSGWQVVYSTTSPNTPANAATWTTITPSLSSVTRIGFVKATVDGDTSTYLPANDAQLTQFTIQIKVRTGQTAPLAIANMAQVFGQTPVTNVFVMDESGDQNPSNFDGSTGNMTPPPGTDSNGNGVPDQLPTTISDGYINDGADLAATGTDTAGTNTGDTNNPGANAGGEANVLIITPPTPSNSAPVLTDTNVNLAPVRANAGTPVGAVGTSVAQLVGFSTSSSGQQNVSDQDAGALLGIALTGINASNGSWFYSTNNGTNWTTLGGVSETNALLLAANTNNRLYFQPNPGFTEAIADAITFRAWDQTSGSNGNFANSSSNGGSTAFSSGSDTASLSVTLGKGVDFNADGNTDLVWRNRFTGDAGIWFMDGATYRDSVVLPTVTSNWVIAGLADFSNDGKTDILWRDQESGINGFWIMDGGSSVGSAALPSVSANWEVLGVGDFSDDGRPDLYWRDRTTGNTGFWIMDGTTISTAVTGESIDTDWVVGGVGDFNGDGEDDLLWNNRQTGGNGVWFLKNTSIASVAVLETVTPNWSIGSVGDFNQDTQPDIVWLNSATGDTGVWLMNGVNRIDAQAITPTFTGNSGWDIA